MEALAAYHETHKNLKIEEHAYSGEITSSPLSADISVFGLTFNN